MQKQRNARARAMAPRTLSTTGATFRNVWRPYHATGETAAPRYSLQSLHLRANSKHRPTLHSRHHLGPNSRHHPAAHSKHHLTLHSRLRSGAWQLATLNAARFASPTLGNLAGESIKNSKVKARLRAG